MNGHIKAMTGYSQKFQPKQELIAMVKEHMNNGRKELSFMMSRLRSGKEVIKYGGDVTMVLSEMKYSFVADTKRLFKGDSSIVSKCMSAAFDSLEQAELSATISSFGKGRYSKIAPMSSLSGSKKSDTYVKVFIRQLIRALLTPDNADLFGVDFSPGRAEIKGLIKRLGHQVSLNYISQQKPFRFLANTIPITGETQQVMELLKKEVPAIN